MLVTHDDRFQIENVKRHDTPGFPSVAWHLPVRGSTFPDALAGYMPDFLVKMRPASKVEPTPPLRHPTWSNCTLPMILLSDYPYNMKSFMVRVVSDVDSLLRVKGLVPDRKATLVLATPSGLDLEPWHAGLLAPYSRRPVISLAELGRRFAEGQPAAWSGEGIRVHCFAQVIVCKLNQHEGRPPTEAAAAIYTDMEPAVPRDPLGLGAAAVAAAGSGSPDEVLKVIIEERTGMGWRTLRNVAEIIRACEQLNAAGFTAGPFKKIVCKAMPRTYTGPAAAAPAAGAVPSADPGLAALRHAVGAVRAAHLLVAVTGSSGANAFFMEPNKASGFIEVRPCGWGTTHAAKANDDVDAMENQLKRGDDAVRFFAYNVEDPAQCSPPDYGQTLSRATQSGPLPQHGHPLQPRNPPRYSPEQLLARDQHVTLRTAPLLEMIKHAAALLPDKSAYQQARNAGRTHGYAVKEGLLLAPGGQTDVAALVAGAGADKLIRV
ncbi:hypothetical protein CHLRE_03g150200v5 [Chlamydomonas reinhardtii]|uniref:Uncharacterized protein n=1 Tax=Chlamydomonas reinhardtii TaxID=3055 RepID=A0A2K3DVM1_CHLRE|nr:uncharacterized protein CHLRE_03g150200v5 [Chlamydomonas reinhardtii]PNW84587.1 hypothetical protein CHLRE_03g150200v5 [Chlamydomonas reinhardtii]